ncbi:hypothetical protein [Streptomyces sp. CB03911]|uniref:hypothetical protein n=1 Tax=Streptomycetaceae TaxID=2062 RepID=UPI00093F4C04|nr:hypothetical protein [Streptomyces sp. CB03911]OKI13309.1 hypothetical protein A6A07_15505 [Streptomyces sp. CB03911]
MSAPTTAYDGTALPETRVEAVATALYALLPAHVRQADLASTGALRALFGVLGLASAEIDAEIEAWYDALFVETADEAALAAIAALVAAPALHRVPGDGGTGRRAFVANTIRYRRGKGTARVVESAAADVTGLPTVVVEYHQRLARLGHLLDLRADRPTTADPTSGGTASSVGGAFDRLPRLLDVRRVDQPRPGRPAGRHAPTSVGVHLLRPLVMTFPAPTVEHVTPADVAGLPRARRWEAGTPPLPGLFQLAQQPGAELRLFNPDRRADAAGARPREVDLPDRLRRLPLHQETAELRAARLEKRPPQLPDRPWFDHAGAPFTVFLRREGRPDFDRVPPEEIRIVNLESPPAGQPAAEVTHTWYEPRADGPERRSASRPIACAVDPVTGRIALPGAPGLPEVAEVRVACATAAGRAVGAGPQDRNAPDQPFDIRDTGGSKDLVWVVDAVAPAGGSTETSGRTVPTLAAALTEVAAQGAGRRSLVLLARCDLEGAPAGSTTLDVTVPPGAEVHLVAAQWRRPQETPGAPADPALRGFVVRRERRYTVDAPMRVLRGTGPAGGPAGRLVLDGLELTRGLRLRSGALAGLELRYVTVRAPGEVAVGADGELDGVRVAIDRTICGPLRLGDTTHRVSGELMVSDSVVTADDAPGDALAAPALDVTLGNVTVLGTSSLRSLRATNSLFTEPVQVTRRQSGCLRYSYVPPGSATPRTFRCQPSLALAAAERAAHRPLAPAEAEAVRLANEPLFLDTSADEPTLALLHPLAPDGIRSGGEDEAEMGAFADAAFGITVADVRALTEEYLPVALEAGIIDDTRSSAVTARRNKP